MFFGFYSFSTFYYYFIYFVRVKLHTKPTKVHKKKIGIFCFSSMFPKLNSLFITLKSLFIFSFILCRVDRCYFNQNFLNIKRNVDKTVEDWHLFWHQNHFFNEILISLLLLWIDFYLNRLFFSCFWFLFISLGVFINYPFRWIWET